MFYVEWYNEEFLGPYILEEAVRICGILNSIDSNSAKALDTQGHYIQ